jgi:predicted peroxiredoxin
LLYTVTEGIEDPTLASVPLHIAANGSLEVGQEVSVVLAGDAAELVTDSARKASAYPHPRPSLAGSRLHLQRVSVNMTHVA